MIRPLFASLLLATGIAFVGAPSARGGVLSLDGIDDWVELSNADGAIPSGNESFTVESWINPTSVPAGGGSGGQITFWGNQAGNQANGFRMQGTDSMVHYFWGNDHSAGGTGDLLSDTGGPNGDGWHHVAYSFDGGANTGTWFHNGAVVGTLNQARNAGVAVADANHRIGSRIGAEWYHGFIDEIRIWDVARSEEDIAENFDKELDAASAGLVAYYQFTAADDFSDATGGGHDGTAMGGATVDPNLNAPAIPSEDADADDLPDAWELRWDGIDDLTALDGLASGPGPGAGTGDFDGDTLTDAEELALGLDPTNADTDGDGLEDGAEVNTHGTNPKRADTDEDGLTDGEEINTYFTDPLDPDSDDDFISDGAEIANNSDPNDANSPSGTASSGALCLDGVSFVTFSNAAGLIPSGDDTFTIESWINPTSIPAGGGSGGQITFWGTQGPQSTSNGFRLAGSGGVRHYFWGNDHDESFGEDILPDTSGPEGDGWHHLAITYDGTQTVWYWNGAPLGNPRPVSGVNVADQNHRIGSRLNAEFFDGWIDELRVWDVARTEGEIADNYTLAIDPATPGLVSYWDFSAGYADITGNGHDGTPMNTATISPLINAPVVPLTRNKLRLAVGAEGDNLIFTWESGAGKLYNLLSAVDPSTDPKTWAVWDGNENMAATAPENTLTIPRPADPTRYFVVEEFDAPPTTIYFEDFELGDAGWTTGGNPGDDPGTAWALGTPSNVGPVGAASGDFCFGTNISEAYTNNSMIWLRSPAIDLSGQGLTEAFLSYAEALDIEFDFDRGSIAVLDAADDSEIVVLLDNIDDTDLDWKQAPRNPVALPAEVLTTAIKLEFRFESDFLNSEPQAGWYIDDVRITD